jgi:hypothetical protein
MKTLRLGTSVKAADVEIVVIEMSSVGGSQHANGLTVFGAKEPQCIIMRRGRRVWAVDLEGREARLDAHLGEVPGLREWLQG